MASDARVTQYQTDVWYIRLDSGTSLPLSYPIYQTDVSVFVAPRRIYGGRNLLDTLAICLVSWFAASAICGASEWDIRVPLGHSCLTVLMASVSFRIRPERI